MKPRIVLQTEEARASNFSFLAACEHFFSGFSVQPSTDTRMSLRSGARPKWTH
ncbi:MAG: hypothetical protein IPJ48_05160 [Propionivibrio sp.]|uniref:Uncharacterized protein n=1 Tax=Candidatus Propionivibrio dominans TaxID=2954373 RepID=A0A9D7I6S0_9RHOO|nr:hypothetical protein [Candidatus Propionivibrio dominans]